MRLIITRPAAQSASWLSRLRAAGVDASALPLIEIAPAPDEQAVKRAWQSLPEMAFVMFVSANAVEHFLAARPPGALWPRTLQAGSPGPGTARALLDAGLGASQLVTPDEAAGRFDSEALWGLIGQRDWAGTQVLVVRGEAGREWLAQRWREAGAQVHFLAAYQRLSPAPDAEGGRLLAQARQYPAEHAWHFSSAEAIECLQALVPGASWQAATALVTHERIEAPARRAGFGCVILVGAGVDEAVRGLAMAAAAGPPSLQSGAS